MTLKPLSNLSAASLRDGAFEALGYEIMAEKAAALGRAGARVEASLARLDQAGSAAADRAALLRDAADAVYAYFIQRELAGFRRHDEVIRIYRIPRAVLARLGAR